MFARTRWKETVSFDQLLKKRRMNYSSDWKFEKLRIAAVFSKWNNFRGNLKSYELRQFFGNGIILKLIFIWDGWCYFERGETTFFVCLFREIEDEYLWELEMIETRYCVFLNGKYDNWSVNYSNISLIVGIVIGMRRKI